jgi:hypothetical protein
MIPITTFTADECQALLDYIDRLQNHIDRRALPDSTNEENEALDKLREAGKFYVK